MQGLKDLFFFHNKYYNWECSVVGTALALHAGTLGSTLVGCEFSSSFNSRPTFFNKVTFKRRTALGKHAKTDVFAQSCTPLEKERRTSLGKGVNALPKDVRL